MAEEATIAAAEDDDGWSYPHRPLLQHYMVSLMSFKDGRWENPYHKTTIFSKEQLLTIRPINIKRWLAMRAFKTPTPPNFATDVPFNERAGSLRKAKHGVSVFMPNQHVAWLDGRGGNPTQHGLITKFLKDVEGLETKGLGKKANDKRAYRQIEWDKKLELLRQRTDFQTQWTFTMMSIWSYHLIHRIDDTAHFKVDDPHGSHDYPFAIFTRTRWSKNVRTMKQCPPQIIFGSMEWQNCCQLHLANYLEMYLKQNSNPLFLFTTKRDIKKAPKNIKQQYRNRISKLVWRNEEFKALEDEPEAHNGCGTHSGRKYYADKASKLGAASAQVEYRGRWVGENGRKVVNRHYISINDIYTDAYVASLLCDGGPIKYEPKDGVALTDDWLFSVVVPCTRQRFGHDNRLCRVLGLARLHAVFHSEMSKLLPAEDVARIKHSFGEYYGDVEGNPVEKIGLEIVRVGTRLEIIPHNNVNPQQQPNDAAATLQASDNRQILAAVLRMERNQEAQLQAIRNEQNAQRQWMEQHFQRVLVNQRKYGGTIESGLARMNPRRREFVQQEATAVAMQRRRAQENPAPNLMPTRAIAPEAKLEPNIRCLLDYWREYSVGIGSNKPAKDFTTDEKNGQGVPFKMKYSRRLKIWRYQVYLLNAGLTIEAANSRLIDVYGTDKPSSIIHCIT